ncbi:MAG TPA: hypothetical protein VK436_15940 [Methanocella sp.]|nr:hypothetical protein [Methanocella sp.]
MRDEVKAVLAFARGPRVLGNPFNTPAFRNFFDRSRSITNAQRSNLISELIVGLEVPDAFQAGCIAATCGTLVEWGGDPTLASAAIAARLAKEAAAHTADCEAMRFLSIAAMAHLCRGIAMRQDARRMPELEMNLERWREQLPEARFVLQVLDLVDDLEILVLAPGQHKGFRVRLEAVSTNFHMFTLLQGALIGDPAKGWLSAKAIDPKILAVATGETPCESVLKDHQRFHFYNWSALRSDGALYQDLRSTIWGEGSPRDIPRHEGRPVVLVGPPLLGDRSWDSNFFANIHDALRSRAEVMAQLSMTEVDNTLTKIAAHAIPNPHDPN